MTATSQKRKGESTIRRVKGPESVCDPELDATGLDATAREAMSINREAEE